MYLHSAELACEKVPRGSLTAGREKNYPRFINVCPNRGIVIQEFSLSDLKINTEEQYN